MSRKHLVFGIDLEESETAPSANSAVNGANAVSIPMALAESETLSETDGECSSADFLTTDASNFGVPAKSRGLTKDVVPLAPDESWQPARSSAPRSEETDSEQVQASLLQLLRTTDRTLMAILTFVGAVLVLFVLNQSIAFIDHLAQSPTWVQWVGGTALVCALAAIVGSNWSLAHRYLKLKQTPAVWLERRQLRELACTKTIDAKYQLEKFLREFPLDRDPTHKWKRLGLAAEAQQALAGARSDLLNPRHGHTNKWLEELSNRFLGPLDSAAQRRVAHYAKRVGIKTALAPAGFMDSTIVIVNSYLLLADLCDLYNVRAGRMGTLRLLVRVGLNTVIAGNLDQPAELLEQELRDSVQDWTATIAAQVVGKVVAKAAEGGTNALLIYRLGKAAMRELRPLRMD